MTIIEKLYDLHKQATAERSHHYVGSVALDAADYIELLLLAQEVHIRYIKQLEKQLGYPESAPPKNAVKKRKGKVR